MWDPPREGSNQPCRGTLGGGAGDLPVPDSESRKGAIHGQATARHQAAPRTKAKRQRSSMATTGTLPPAHSASRLDLAHMSQCHNGSSSSSRSIVKGQEIPGMAMWACQTVATLVARSRVAGRGRGKGQQGRHPAAAKGPPGNTGSPQLKDHPLPAWPQAHPVQWPAQPPAQPCRTAGPCGRRRPPPPPPHTGSRPWPTVA